MVTSIREARGEDLETLFEIINDSAQAYKGVIPASAWHEPYMPLDHLQSEIAKGVRFYCAESGGRVVGVMGVQDVKDVTLIRHAYVRSDTRGGGVGRELLEFATRLTTRPVLIGAWKTASWAIRFYQKNGFTLMEEAEKNRLLRIYWTISPFQVQESVVLADRRWQDRMAQALLRLTYAGFNSRDINGTLSFMSPDVVWPNGMEGGEVVGHDAVRAYWTRQWKQIDPRVEPRAIKREPDGRYAVTVYQLIKDMSGAVLIDREVQHVFTLTDGLIAAMEIREKAGVRIDCGMCVVRDWAAGDQASLLRFADNRKVWRNLTHRFPSPYTDADADAWLARMAQSAPSTNWAIEVDGVAAGGIGIEPGEGVYVQSARFGYWLGEPYWGRGITTQAVRGTVDHIFDNFDLERLEAPVFEWNPPSMRVLEKCGFVREGVLRKSILKDGRLIDAVLYARLRSRN